MEQLRVLGESIRAPVLVQEGASDAVKICRQAFEHIRTTNSDAIILDTAGRLQIDEELMQELRDIKQATNPHYTFLVVDAMTGQEAVKVAKAFDEAVAAVAHATEHLLAALVTTAPPKNREEEAVKARARAEKRRPWPPASDRSSLVVRRRAG